MACILRVVCCQRQKTVPIAKHSRNSRSFSDSKHFVCSTCQKCVFNANHDSCVTKFLNEVNSRAKWWKPTSKIFKTVGLRWVPTGKIFTSSTTKVDSEPQNGSNDDITKQYECKQTLDVSAVMTSDHNSLELRIHNHSNELSSSKLVPKVVPPADKTDTSRQELELLFHHHITMLRFEDVPNVGKEIHFLGLQIHQSHDGCGMSKKQDCTAMSSAEAEYVALSASCAQVMWMRTQLQDYGFNYNKIPLYCDSQSAIAISCNPVQHSRTKHIHTRYHFIKEQVENGIIELYFVRTEYQLADMFTKALPEERFQYLVRRIGMRCLTPAELEVLTKESA
ncbi:hypothetical protein Tco_1163316 [Tanacetum coccineum]